MTQAAVSKGLADLEEVLAAPLFDRTGRSLKLTSLGEMFIRYATLGLATLRKGVDAVADAGSGNRTLAFGALPSVEASIVPSALQAFSATSIACPVVVQSGPSPYLLDLLRTGIIEFVVGRMAGTAAMEGLSFEHLCSEELAFVVRPSHPLSDTASPTLRELAKYQFLMPTKTAIIRPEFDALMLSAGISRFNISVETVSNTLGRSYALSSDAIWIISHGVVASDLAGGHLVRLPIDMSTTVGPVGVTFRSAADLSELAYAFIEHVRAAVRDGGAA
jgi:LysR family pca operon transcriptional activator